MAAKLQVSLSQGQPFSCAYFKQFKWPFLAASEHISCWSNGDPLDKYTVEYAEFNKQHKCLDYAIKNGCPQN